MNATMKAAVKVRHAAKKVCCKPLELVLVAARRNRGLVVAEDGALIWDMAPAAEVLDSEKVWDKAEINFCPFCGSKAEKHPEVYQAAQRA